MHSQLGLFAAEDNSDQIFYKEVFEQCIQILLLGGCEEVVLDYLVVSIDSISVAYFKMIIDNIKKCDFGNSTAYCDLLQQMMAN